MLYQTENSKLEQFSGLRTILPNTLRLNFKFKIVFDFLIKIIYLNKKNYFVILVRFDMQTIFRTIFDAYDYFRTNFHANEFSSFSRVLVCLAYDFLTRKILLRLLQRTRTSREGEI